MFVAEQTFEALRAAGFATDEQKLGVPRILIAEEVEVFKTWLGVEFDDVFAGAAPTIGSHGLRVASLRHVLQFKRASARSKDLPDIEALERALR